MSQEPGVSMEILDELHQTLATELAALLDLGEEMIAELDAIDELRIAMTLNGARILAARRARRSAAWSVKTAIECSQQARDLCRQTSDLAKELDGARFLGRTLVDERRHRSALTSPPRKHAVAA